jgi:hypothetical protein
LERAAAEHSVRFDCNDEFMMILSELVIIVLRL